MAQQQQMAQMSPEQQDGTQMNEVNQENIKDFMYVNF